MGRTAIAVIAAVAALAPASAARSGHAADEPRVIEVAAKRFAFEPEVIEVERGERVRLLLRSEDVTHGLEIEAYDVKVKIPRGGEPVSLELVADRPGTFRVTCSEYCGSGHRRMRGTLVVRDGGEEGAGSR